MTEELKNVGASMLNPFELVRVIEHCLKMNTDWGLQMAVMINVSVQMYLRNKEMKTIQFSHLKWDLSGITSTGVVKGVLLKL